MLNSAAESCMYLNEPSQEVLELCLNIHQIWLKSYKNPALFNIPVYSPENLQAYTLLDRLETLQTFDLVPDNIDFYLSRIIHFVKYQGGKNYEDIK